MSKGKILFLAPFLFSLYSCQKIITSSKKENVDISSAISDEENALKENYYRGFSLDNVLHSKELGDIHYNVMFPSNYSEKETYPLFITLPGYQGLYRFGVGANLKTEDFAFEAQKYVKDMIILAPQLNDWGTTSARQTIELTHYFLDHYHIDPKRVFAEGYSGGGETMSTAMGIEPGIFTRYLHCSSQWDGDLGVLTKSQTPVYLVVGERDEYYGSSPTISTYHQIRSLYEEKGLDEDAISKLVTLDVKGNEYFSSKAVTNQHGGGGYLFCRDEQIMTWLFQK